jgi:hypothetical protein
MTDSRSLDAQISTWMEEHEAGTQYPERLLEATFERTRSSRQVRAFGPSAWRPPLRSGLSVAAAGVAILVIASGVVVFGGLAPGAATPGVTAPATADASVGPSATIAAAPVPTTPWPTRGPDSILGVRHDGVLLDWTTDGTRLLIQKDRENLFIVGADGTETQVTDALTGISRFLGSAFPAGATISPDGSRVVFAGLTKPAASATSCHDGGIFAVDATGGAPVLLFATHIPERGIVRYPTFSPDGTMVAFTDGYCDQNHHIWVMNADGSDQREIVTPDDGFDALSTGDAYGFFLGGTHVWGLAWSADGTRIAVKLDGDVITFTPTGTDLQRGTGGTIYCWPEVTSEPC